MKSFLTGIATGLAIGYLTAPRSGKESRDQLADTVDAQTKGLKEQWEKAKEQVGQLVDKVTANADLVKAESVQSTPEKTDKPSTDMAYQRDQAKASYNEQVADTATKAEMGVDKAEQALKL